MNADGNRTEDDEEAMRCLVCKQGEVGPGRATVTLQRQACTVVFRDVPADVCDNCGEYYLNQQVTTELFEAAEAAVRRGAEIEVVRYAAGHNAAAASTRART